MHVETLADFLSGQPGYRIDGDYLIRPDNSIAEEYRDGRWTTNPFPSEMAQYTLNCGRGMPSFLLEKDLTNPGCRLEQRRFPLLPPEF